MVRTRIAPSPTGFPHIGTIYQALFNYAFAKKNNGHFLVRIEDTDQSRFVPGAVEMIFSFLDWFRLIENESLRFGGPFGSYRQSERLALYKKHAEDLVRRDKAYYCFCTPERLAKVREKQMAQGSSISMYDKHCRNLPLTEISEKLDEHVPHVIRLKVPENEMVVVHDEIRGDITFDSSTIDDQVLLKSDSFPTYHLAVVVDDHEMEITHVVRGEEWLTSFPKHILLYHAFGWKQPLFFHTPVLRNPDHSKLSKRHGHTSVEWYKEEGFLPDAILNFLALMGWSHPEEKEIFDLNEFISLFELKDLKPVGPIFDLKKLEWMNGIYIRQLQIPHFKFQILDFEPRLKEIPDNVLDELLPIVQTRIKTLKEVHPLIEPFLHNHENELSEEEKELKKSLYDDLKQLKNWKTEEISQILMQNYISVKRTNFKTLYKIVLGTDRGLPLADTFAAVGQDATIALLSK